jgi:hypothetical protein
LLFLQISKILFATNSVKKTKKERENSVFPFFLAVSSCYFRSFFLVLAVTAMAHKVTTMIAAAIEMSAALLNSGTVGVEEEPIGPGVPVAPVAPLGPVGPVAPVGHVAPVGPVAPVAPVAP